VNCKCSGLRPPTGAGIVDGRRYWWAGTCLIVATLLFLSSCGYQLVSEKGIYGGEISSVYVPIFKNKTFEPHASLYVTNAFTKELVSIGLFKVNKDDSDGYIEGTIRSILITPSTMSGAGIVVEKNIRVDVDLSLFRKNGVFIKRWSLYENEIYRTDDINSEDYNKRDALTRLSERMARKFSSVILMDY
jgi:Lipopolysaccharide-assembly